MQSVKHYQELKGAEASGIRVTFASKDALEFFNNHPPSALLLGVNFDIKEISLTGLVLEIPERVSMTDVPGSQILTLLQKGTAFYQCPVILQPQQSSTKTLTVLYDEKGVDLEVIARKNAAALAVSETATRKPAVTYSVPAEYKIYCTEVLDFLSDRRTFIERNITPYEDYFTLEETESVAEGLEQTSLTAWQQLCFQGNELVLPHKGDAEARKDLKSFTEKLVTYELVKGLNWNRSYFKPMGYPGDFKIMNYMYDHRPEGTDTYSRYLHMLGLISGGPIVSRMEYISRYLKELNDGSESMYHVMSIGSGPAREVQRFLEDTYEAGEGYSFTLVDQEKDALDYAINAAYRSLAPSRSNVIVSGMHTSFTEMLRPMSTFRHIPQQDLIYSAGLLDYLSPNMCRNLTRKLYEHLKPGGTLLVGNVNDAPMGTYWSMEYVLDWTLFFRSEDEMFDMAAGCQGADVSVDMDENGAVYMLKVVKQA